MAKMKKKWVALCSTAIAAVYAAGYLTTETQASIQRPLTHIQVNMQPTGSQPSGGQLNAAQPSETQPTADQSADAQPPSETQPTAAQSTDAQPSVAQPSEAQPTVAPPTITQPSQPSQPSQPTVAEPTPAQQTPAQPTPAQPSPTPVKSLYKDGTYTGMGSNRRGSIQVTVTIKKDKITDVEISDFAMHYSESDVVGLPAEVLQYQSAQVDNVSGATYSTQAFEDAVQDAVSQAQNA